MDRLLIMMRLLREIHERHLATISGYRYELLLANDRAYLALLNGDESAVWQYADLARSAYIILGIPDNYTLASSLAALITVSEPTTRVA